MTTTVPRNTHNATRVHGTVRYRLQSRRGSVTLPQPTQEYGGLWPVHPGFGALIDIGAAQYIDPLTALLLAGAVTDASRIEVIGDDPHGVATIVRAMDTRRRRDDQGA